MTGNPILDTFAVLSDVLVRAVLLALLLGLVYAVGVGLPAEMRAVAARQAARAERAAEGADAS